MYLFERGDIVYIRDFPMGKPTRIKGKIVGVLPNDFYNILLTNGMNADTIRRYKSFKLIDERDVHIDLEEN